MGTITQSIIMNILGKEKLHAFKQRHADVRSQVDAWEAEVAIAKWCTPQDIKQRYASASFLADNIVIFNLKGVRYRLKTKVNYPYEAVLIMNAGTHNEYTRW
ncbi:MAG: type II toxin-antitoxin system HigB family toxin [Candidatus Moraniibacteriota bacterium]